MGDILHLNECPLLESAQGDLNVAFWVLSTAKSSGRNRPSSGHSTLAYVVDWQVTVVLTV